MDGIEGDAQNVRKSLTWTKTEGKQYRKHAEITTHALVLHTLQGPVDDL